jgi:hypothetical protein
MINTYKCPKGHESTELDFCSECGLKINGIAQELIAKSGVVISGENCPDCGTIHELHSGKFCEICGYNFATGGHGEIPIATIETPTTVQVVEIPKTAKKPEIVITKWELFVTVDTALGYPESPAPPTDQPPLIFTLERATNLIGRTNQAKAVYPEISLDFDSAISHRHALLTRQADGSFTLRDIGSSNGTLCKGVELKPMVDVPLQEGDEFTLGHWTRIKIRNSLFPLTNN